MIGETNDQQSPETNKGLIAVRDSAVIFILVLVANLIDVGYPPTIEVLYTSILTGILTGVVSYMHALGISKPTTTT